MVKQQKWPTISDANLPIIEWLCKDCELHGDNRNKIQGLMMFILQIEGYDSS